MFGRMDNLSNFVGKTLVQAVVVGFVLFVFDKAFSLHSSLALWLGCVAGFALLNMVELAIRSAKRKE
jgi:hypothetical protein